MQEANARLLAHNERIKQQVQVGIGQIARGEFIEEDEMDARVERMLVSDRDPAALRDMERAWRPALRRSPTARETRS